MADENDDMNQGMGAADTDDEKEAGTKEAGDEEDTGM